MPVFVIFRNHSMASSKPLAIGSLNYHLFYVLQVSPSHRRITLSSLAIGDSPSLSSLLMLMTFSWQEMISLTSITLKPCLLNALSLRTSANSNIFLVLKLLALPLASSSLNANMLLTYLLIAVTLVHVPLLFQWNNISSSIILMAICSMIPVLSAALLVV